MTWTRTTIAAAALVACGLSPLQVNATLLLSPDGRTVYDTANNVGWLADADLAATNRFGLPLCTGSATQPCVNASGSMRYQSAVAWVNAINAANYLGHSNWQLPTTPSLDNGCGRTGPTGNSFGFGCTASAFASLYNTLGLKAPAAAVPTSILTVGPFSNFQPYLYWSQTGAPPPAGNETFSFATGWQGANTLPNLLYVLPMVHGKIPGTPPASGNGLQVNPGGQTVYDPMTDLTWLANADVAASNTFGLPRCIDPTTPALCVADDGAMTLASANQFIANMNSGAGYLGQTHWQLPTIDQGCPGYNCSGTRNPMGNLFYDQLSFTQGMSVVPAATIAVGPFRNIQPYLYWTCEAARIQDVCQTDGPAPNFEWSFSFGSGFEGTDLLANDLYVTAYFVGAPASGPVNYQGLWWASPAGSESGWGINFAHQGDVIFATWFTYDTAGKAWWLTMTANKTSDGVYSGTLVRTNGTPFSAFVPPATATAVGTATVTFSSGTTGTFAYQVNDGSTSVATQTKAIALQTFGPLPMCVWGAQPKLSLATNFQDLWWATGGAESGWGVNLTHQGTTIFATWFTYDANHDPLWYSVTAPQTAPNTYSGALLRTNGPAFSAVPFNPALVGRTVVGSATFNFTDGNAGSFTYSVNDGPNVANQTKTIARQVFRPPGTVCQ